MGDSGASEATGRVSLAALVEGLFPLRGSNALFISLLADIKCDALSDPGCPHGSDFLATLNDFMIPDPNPGAGSDPGRSRRILKLPGGREVGVLSRENRSNDRRSKLRALYKAFKASEPAEIEGESTAGFLEAFHRLKSKQSSSVRWRRLLRQHPACTRRLGRHLVDQLFAAVDLEPLYEEFTGVTTRFLCTLVAQRTPAEAAALTRERMLPRLDRNPHKFRGYGYVFQSVQRRLQSFSLIAEEMGLATVPAAVRECLDQTARLQFLLAQTGGLDQFAAIGAEIYRILREFQARVAALQAQPFH